MNDYNNGIPMTELPRMFVWKNAVGDKEYAFGPAVQRQVTPAKTVMENTL